MNFYGEGIEVLQADGFLLRDDHPRLIVKAILDLDRIDQAREVGGCSSVMMDGTETLIDTGTVREILFGDLIHSYSLQGCAVSMYRIANTEQGELQAKIAYFNDLFLQNAIVTGYLKPGTKMKDLYGKTLIEAGVSVESDQTFGEEVFEVAQTGRSKTTEREVVFPSGEHSRLIAQIIPISDGDGNVILIMNAIKDLAESSYGHTLESRVIRAALDALGRLPANAEAARIGYTLDHDGRNQLMTSLGNSELAISILEGMRLANKIQPADFDDLMACLNPILDATRGLLQMLKSVREHLSNREENYVPIDIMHKIRGILLLECAKQYDEFIGEKYGGRVTINIQREFHLIAIPYLVRMVISNILKNGMDAVIEKTVKNAEHIGYGHIHIECSMDDRANSVIKITDNGVGMDRATQNKIFGLGFTTKAGLQVDGIVGGQGIGLTNIRDYIDLQHGSISVESELGVGTEFTLKFPPRISYGQMM